MGTLKAILLAQLTCCDKDILQQCQRKHYENKSPTRGLPGKIYILHVEIIHLKSHNLNLH